MAEYPKGFRGMWMKGMEAIGDTATKIASNTRYKVNEMNMVNRRREILSDFGEKAYGLWKQGERFPEELDALLKELSQLDASLDEIRAEKAAKAATAAAGPEANPAEQAPLVDKADELADKVRDVLNTVGDAIGEAVDHVKEAVSGDRQPDGEKTVSEKTDSEPSEDSIPTIQVEEEAPAAEEPEVQEPAEEPVPTIQVQEEAPAAEEPVPGEEQHGE